MTIKTKYHYIFIWFITLFAISIIGSTIEDYFHNIPIIESLSDFYHYIMPAIFGILSGLFGLFYWKRKNQQHMSLEQLKESEYKHRILFENMHDIVCILDNQGNIIEANEAAIKLYGYSREELLNMNVSDLVYEEDMNNSKEYLNKLNISGFYNMYEGRVKTKSGEILWIQVNSREYLKDGIKVGSQDIIRNITSRKENEQNMFQLNKKLKELNDTKDKFFSIIAHDLKGPFNSILGFSELLSNEFDNFNNTQKRKYIKIIHNSVNNAYILLENLLTWSQTQKSTFVINLEKLNLYLLASEVIKLISLSAKKKSIEIENLISESIIVKADEAILSTILRNLISNSIKFTPNGGNIEINARLISNNSDQNFAEIAVKDNGVGISKEIQSQIFDISYNTTTSGTNNEKGTGLGLILCKEFVEKQNGKIWIESTAGVGSTFFFTLPLDY